MDARVPYIDPSFEALLKCQIKFASDAMAHLKDLKDAFDREAHGQHFDDVEAVLQEIRDLNVVRQASALDK